MSIKAYEKLDEEGKMKTFYMVGAEAINKYTGKRVQKRLRGIPSLPKAERAYRELWSLCREEKPDGLNFKSWGELVDHYLDYIDKNVRSKDRPNGFSLSLSKCKCSQLKHTQGWDTRHIELVTPQFVTSFLDEREKEGMSRVMTNQVLQQVRSVFAYGVELGVIVANPFLGVKARKVPKKRKLALTHEEVALLFAEATRREHPYYEIWMLTIALGLRRSELAGLKWSDIDWKHGLIYLQRQLLPFEGLVEVLKNKEERIVSIPEQIMPFLKEMKIKSSSEFVIETKCGRWKIGHQSAVIREFCREIGIKEVTHHQLRATHITLALIDGVPLGIVKENVGHAKLSTTDVYFRSAGINMKGQMNGLRIRVPVECEGGAIPFKKVD